VTIAIDGCARGVAGVGAWCSSSRGLVRSAISVHLGRASHGRLFLRSAAAFVLAAASRAVLAWQGAGDDAIAPAYARARRMSR